ncbi:hypothetical protein G6F50_014675 [Rhizopus delemar]|uniref:Uncharacterized protein n=1 Tax=Rhizopus delemar TaxID=936053 RepID=A0A9P6Y3P2_9FUNG|nr:hypothetical protein G6F50_014675 [Rhizopus delemar]
MPSTRCSSPRVSKLGRLGAAAGLQQAVFVTPVDDGPGQLPGTAVFLAQRLQERLQQCHVGQVQIDLAVLVEHRDLDAGVIELPAIGAAIGAPGCPLRVGGQAHQRIFPARACAFLAPRVAIEYLLLQVLDTRAQRERSHQRRHQCEQPQHQHQRRAPHPDHRAPPLPPARGATTSAGQGVPLAGTIWISTSIGRRRVSSQRGIQSVTWPVLASMPR